MRTHREFYFEKVRLCRCETEKCPVCETYLKVAYHSDAKTVQTLEGTFAIVHVVKQCLTLGCAAYQVKLQSAEWLQIAPIFCTYGYDVIAQIGWLRQIKKEQFATIAEKLSESIQISETEVRNLYHERYLPLLACHERQFLDELKIIGAEKGIILSLDGLAPEGGEPQLWVVRELRSGLTLRSGWLAKQDATTFCSFLQPIADLQIPVLAVLSDKQRGLLPAIETVFPNAKHGFCQVHYLKNASIPVAEADEAMKIVLRQAVREEIGEEIRTEKVEESGVLTTTGLLPSPIEELPLEEQPVEQQSEHIRQDLKRRIRHLLTLKGRPPFRLAGIEMFEKLSEMCDICHQLLSIHPDPEFKKLHLGLQSALKKTCNEYTLLNHAANWLEKIADLLDPEGKQQRSSVQVKQELLVYLQEIEVQSAISSRLEEIFLAIEKTTHSYLPGLFHCYDLPELPRTNNQRESEFRDLNRRLLSTTGQKGLVRRILQRTGVWELIPRPATFALTVQALSNVSRIQFIKERLRIRQHRRRFRLISRSRKLASAQLSRLVQDWAKLHSANSS